MMSVLLYIAVAAIGYLLGSLNFAIIISKLVMKEDIRNFGSGNAGSTNALRVMGAKKTVFVVLGDIVKTIIAVFVAKAVAGAFATIDIDLAVVFASAACVLGHSFPVYFGFRGGKGVLTTASVVACLDWRIFAIAFPVFILVVAITGYVSLGSIVAAWSLVVLFGIFSTVEYFILMLCIAAFVTFLHRENIKRLISGTENKFKFKK
ncbi:MAG: glycerol-3-phosphate 1-O-acyltransferase PlsY [Oscillospiraceae bacterium]|nr:glycerol-3-phosphate 1-O-acyltransferase PlsY [Oscillospiraceae bacterium]